MTKKTYLFNKINKNSQEKLIVNREIIVKSYIREILEDNYLINTIDNSHTVSDIIIERDTIKGESVNVNMRTLRHKHWKTLQIKVPLLSNARSKNIAENFVTKFSFFKKKQKNWSTILGVEKGGYTARSFGILGFLPKHQICLNKKKETNFFYTKSHKLRLFQKTVPNITKKKWKFLRKRWYKKKNNKEKKEKPITIEQRQEEIKREEEIIKNRKKQKIASKKSPFIFYTTNNFYKKHKKKIYEK